MIQGPRNFPTVQNHRTMPHARRQRSRRATTVCSPKFSVAAVGGIVLLGGHIWWVLVHLKYTTTHSMYWALDETGTSSRGPSYPQRSNSDASTSPHMCRRFLSNVTSHTFYPKRFFEEGAGRPFHPNLEHNLYNLTDILNARFLVYEVDGSTFSYHDKLEQQNNCSIVHYHIHKNGGTTLERHISLPMDNYYSKREKSLGHDKFEAACTKVMEDVHRKQQLQQAQPYAIPKVHTFTFLRDPVPRFLSSVAQVLKLRVWHKRLHPCYETSTNSSSIIATGELIDCVLDKLETGSFPEMHLSPQSYELYKQIMGFDIAIQVLDLGSAMGTVLEQLGAKSVPKERSTTGTLIRRFPQFRLNMEALNPTRIARICRIYAADVAMLQETQVTNSLCFQVEHSSSVR